MENLLLVFPVLGLGYILVFALIGISLGIVWAVRQSAKEDDAYSKELCSACGKPILKAASTCLHCKAKVSGTRDVNISGKILSRAALDESSHELKLLSAGRCPSCANFFKKNVITQTCEQCGNPTVSEKKEVLTNYVGEVEKRLKNSLIISLIAGLIPFLGSVITIVYAEIHLGRPFKQYEDTGKGFLVRFLTKIGIFILILLQGYYWFWGCIFCPIMAYIYHFSWKYSFQKQYGLA